jgi:hypothetical protein
MLNSKGSTLIFVLSLAVILNIVFASVYFTINHTQKATGIKRVQVSALSLAEAGKEKIYGAITQKIFIPIPNTRVNVYTDEHLNKGTFTVSCSSNTALDTVWIESQGQENASLSMVNVVASIRPDINLPAHPVRGAVTARNTIIVRGNINVDGRDHDTDGVLTGAGVFGVSTCGLMDVEGSATVGGTGVAPVNRFNVTPVRTKISEENVPVTSSLNSPEEFLGLAVGALDKYKTAMLTTPVEGIVYDTISAGPVHFDSSYGLLIVHNSSKSAELQINTGYFKGLIITDLMGKISGNAKIVGAVVTLNDGEVSTFGTGTADVLYSSYVMENLSKYCKNIKKKVTEISWEEIKK